MEMIVKILKRIGIGCCVQVLNHSISTTVECYIASSGDKGSAVHPIAFYM